MTFPDLGERIFGFSKREEKIKDAIQGVNSFQGRIISMKDSKYGKTAILRTKLSNGMTIRLQLSLGFQPGFSIGDLVCAWGDAAFPKKATNPGEWDQQLYARTHYVDLYLKPTMTRLMKPAGSWSVFLFLLRSRDAFVSKIKALFPSPYDGIIAAMVTGENSLLEEEERDLFSQAGIAHIIAISGLHLSVLVALLEKIGKPEMVSKRRRIVTILFVWAYAFWTGGSVATVRSALMVSTRHTAPLVSQKPDLVSSLAFSMLLQLVLNPLLIFGASFWLSYGALLGIRLGSRLMLRLRHLKVFSILPFPVYKKVASSLGVLLITFPIIQWFFYKASWLSFLLNLWVIPAMELLLPFVLLAILLSFIYLPLGTGFAFLARGLLKSFEWGSKAVIFLEDHMPVLTKLSGKPDLVYIVIYYLFLWVLFRWIPHQRKSMSDLFMTRHEKHKFIFISGCLFVLLLYLILPSHRWKVTYLDVGQGDACVIEWEGKVIIVDAGPSYKQVIQPYLKMRGIRKVDLMILSHPDQDHMEGMLHLAKDGHIQVKELWMADQKIQETAKRQELEELLLDSGTTIYKLKGGKQGSLFAYGKEMILSCVSPYEEFEDTNGGSLAVLILFNRHCFLFTGDMDAFAEEEMLQKSEMIHQAEGLILKTAHHGSDTSTSEILLKALHPHLAVISCGRNNPYGHPSKAVLQRFETYHIPYRVTARNGAVYLQGFGNGIHYYTFLK